MRARLQYMTRAERTVNLIGVVVPFVGLLAAVVLLWNRAVDATDLAIMVVTYILFGLGVTVGFHALAARGARLGAQGPLARPHRLADGDARTG